MSQGTFNMGDGKDIPSNFTLKVIKGGLNLTHSSDLINIWGHMDPQTRQFNPDYISFISETWDLTPENFWGINQWAININLQGEMTDVTQTKIIETINNEVLEYQNNDIDPDSNKAIDELRELIKKYEQIN